LAVIVVISIGATSIAIRKECGFKSQMDRFVNGSLDTMPTQPIRFPGRGKFLAFLLLVFAARHTAFATDSIPCSLAKTNNSCTLTIDRRAPLAPPNIQMYPGETLTVELRDPYYFERYYLDYASGQLNLLPDQASSILNGFLTPLQKFAGAAPLQVCDDTSFDGKIPMTAADVTTYDSLYTNCLTSFANQAVTIYQSLEGPVYPDSHPVGSASLGSNSSIQIQLNTTATQIDSLIRMEAQMSAAVAYVSKTLDTLAATGTTTLTTDQAAKLRKWVAGVALTDAVAKDLTGYSSRIGGLPGLPSSPCQYAPDTARYQTPPAIPDSGVCVDVFPLVDPPVSAASLVTRQVTYAINALNLVQNSPEAVDATKRKTVASVTVIYGDSRWEASAGTLISTLANRSFPVVPVFTNGVVTDKTVGRNILHPTYVPFVGANYRLSRDLAWTKWRSAWYFTFAVGVNPNTTTADFAAGPSLSFRGLMFSALWHAGHDVRVTQGIYTGESLGVGFSGSVPTQTYWRLDRVAFGVSVRVPALTGR
jgi:hypothetical protein